MKTQDHHNELPESEIRNLLGQMLQDLSVPARAGFRSSDSRFINQRESLVRAFEDAKRALQLFDLGVGVRAVWDAVTEPRDWEEWDVSDIVDFDADYVSFIGTKEECRERFGEEYSE